MSFYTERGDELDKMLQDRKRAEKMESIVNEKLNEKDRAAFLYMLNHKNGRWFLMRLFERCHLLGGSILPTAHTDELCVMEGERRVGIALQALSTMDTERLELKQLAEREYLAYMLDLQRTVEAVKEVREDD